MIVLDTVGDTIQAEASAASAITVTCYGVETASGAETYKRLGMGQLTGAATQDTLYTVPASTSTICTIIVIANTSGTDRTIKLWHVPNGDGFGDANAIMSGVNIRANSTMMWNRGNIQNTQTTSTPKFIRPLILIPQMICGPATNYATLDTIVGGSTPAEVITVLDFDPNATEYADFKIALPNDYNGGGLTCTPVCSMTSDHDEGTPHKVRWEIAIRRINDDAEDINGVHAYQYNGVSVNVPSEIGEVTYDDITFTDGADMDSLAINEMAILRIRRKHDHEDDNATGDAELQMIIIKET